jgi:hypothetical protein
VFFSGGTRFPNFPEIALPPGLPDCIFLFKNLQFGYIWEGLGVAMLVYNVQMEYLTAIWYILWRLGNFMAIWYQFGILCQEKSGNPGCRQKDDRRNEAIYSCTEKKMRRLNYSVHARTARFFLPQHTKMGKNVPNDHKLLTKWP